MDNPNSANNNDINQQLSSMSTPIVSTLTTVTPITSEIVSDFEPDPKFEITPLEMASYDCSDIYAANLIEEHHQQPLLNNDNNVEIQKEVEPDLVQVEQQKLIVETSKPQSVELPANPTKIHQDLPKMDAKTEQSQTDQRRVIIDQSETLVESKTIDADLVLNKSAEPATHEKAEIASNTEAPDVAQIEKIDEFQKQSCDDQQLDLVALPDVIDPLIKTSDNSYSMTQSSVDAQMEKVIDNIVELGGVHQFPHSLGQPEGKEELLASIHREITSERSSIDLIADVASRQQSIEITPTVAPQQYSTTEDSKKTQAINVITEEPKQLLTHQEIIEESVVIEKPSTGENLSAAAPTPEVIKEKVSDETVDLKEESTVKKAEEKKEKVGRKSSTRLQSHRLRPTPSEEQPKADLISPIEKPTEPTIDPVSKVESSIQETGLDSNELVEKQGERTRSLRSRNSLKRAHSDEASKEDPPKVDPPKKQFKRAQVAKPPPMIKLPSYRSRTTISASDPISRLDKKFEAKSAPTPNVRPEAEKKFICDQCGFATDRLNNLVYHSTKSYCEGKLQIGEVMKADIIRQQQQAKSKRRSMR